MHDSILADVSCGFTNVFVSATMDVQFHYFMDDLKWRDFPVCMKSSRWVTRPLVMNKHNDRRAAS